MSSCVCVCVCVCVRACVRACVRVGVLCDSVCVSSGGRGGDFLYAHVCCVCVYCVQMH